MKTRRSFLYLTTGCGISAGLIAAVWPLIDQANVGWAARATNDLVELDLAELMPGHQLTVHWRKVPVFVVRRTADMLRAMQEKDFVAQLSDANSQKRQQPKYATNWHRSIDPEYAVLVGVCTSCACVPTFFEEASPLSSAGGYVCPCCASRFDAAGRSYSGPAQYNLPVPPYRMTGKSRLLLGRNANDESFALESIERL